MSEIIRQLWRLARIEYHGLWIKWACIRRQRGRQKAAARLVKHSRALQAMSEQTHPTTRGSLG